MPRVSKETLDKLNEFLDTLPAEAQGKCTLCTDTLTHIVKSAEAKTGAPTATITKELASRVNDGAAPGDKVTGQKLRNRVNNQERKDICVKNTDKPGPEPEIKICPVCESEYPGDYKHCPNECEIKKPKKKRSKPYFNPASVMSKDFSKAFDAFIKEVANARKEHWETTSKEAVAQCLRSIQFYLGEE